MASMWSTLWFIHAMIQVDHSWEYAFQFNNIFRNNPTDLAMALGIALHFWPLF